MFQIFRVKLTHLYAKRMEECDAVSVLILLDYFNMLKDVCGFISEFQSIEDFLKSSSLC